MESITHDRGKSNFQFLRLVQESLLTYKALSLSRCQKSYIVLLFSPLLTFAAS